MQNKPTSLGDALAQVRGAPTAEQPQPANLTEALAHVRALHPAAAQVQQPANTTAKAPAKHWWERKA